MDLSKIMSGGPPARTPSQSQNNSPETNRQSVPLGAPPPAPLNGHGSHPANTASIARTTPTFAPPSFDYRPTPGSFPSSQKGLTPLQTPQGQQSAYPFPQQPVQSPASGPGYRPYGDGYPSVQTPGGYQRPPSQQHQSSPGSHHYPPSMLAAMSEHSQSHSPAASSHHSAHTPIRNSPLSRNEQGSLPSQQPQHHQHLHSQPNTPLGPPSAHFQRTSGHSSYGEIPSPYHPRRVSGASANGFPFTGSPAQQSKGMGRLMDSPNAVYRQSPNLRRTSGHVSSERERSVSVSPKTIVQPKPPSLSSRQSSTQDLFSARSSIAAPLALQQPPQPPSHQGSYASQSAPQPVFGHEVSQSPMQPTPIRQAPSHQGATGVPVSQAPHSYTPQAQQLTPDRPQLVHQSSSKMGMQNLLSPTSTDPQPPASLHGAGSVVRQSSNDIFAKPSPKDIRTDSEAHSPARVPQYQPHHIQPPEQQRQPQQAKEKSPPTFSQSMPIKNSLLQQPLLSQQNLVTNGDVDMESAPPESRKRAADSEPPEQPPQQKVKRTRKYPPGRRPPWAMLSKQNPHGNSDGAKIIHNSQSNGNMSQISQANGQSRQQTTQTGLLPPDLPAWQINPPLDHDLVNARSILGQWEKTFEYNTPFPDMVRAVQEWLLQNLDRNSDIGSDPKEGAIEIEAKIGILKDPRNDMRANLPALNAIVIPPDWNTNVRFESKMDEAEHKLMNQYLNTLTQQSHMPGRVRMDYKHLYETDSFVNLSAAGIAALSQSALKRRKSGREIKLRVTTNTKPGDPHAGEVRARIVKIPLADLHIYNPSQPYDCRISMNLEVNLDRPELDPLDLMEPSAPGKGPPAPARKKDRLSYKHLAYSIDLTKVEVDGMEAKYELELEVDAALLKEQMKLFRDHQPNAFTDIVSGFLDNVTFLMRQRVQQRTT